MRNNYLLTYSNFAHDPRWTPIDFGCQSQGQTWGFDVFGIAC